MDHHDIETAISYGYARPERSSASARDMWNARQNEKKEVVVNGKNNQPNTK